MRQAHNRVLLLTRECGITRNQKPRTSYREPKFFRVRVTCPPKVKLTVTGISRNILPGHQSSRRVQQNIKSVGELIRSSAATTANDQFVFYVDPAINSIKDCAAIFFGSSGGSRAKKQARLHQSDCLLVARRHRSIKHLKSADTTKASQHCRSIRSNQTRRGGRY